MPSRNIQWKSKKLAAPWKRIVAFLCDIIILLPPVAMVAGKYNFNPIPDVSLFSWTLYSLWGMYTIFLGIGLPLYANFAGVGDAVIKIGVTDLHGHRIGRLKLCARQFVCCLLLLW
ncbi:MAG: RDD family protein, partial [Bacteroidota bacterium]